MWSAQKVDNCEGKRIFKAKRAKGKFCLRYEMYIQNRAVDLQYIFFTFSINHFFLSHAILTQLFFLSSLPFQHIICSTPFYNNYYEYYCRYLHRVWPSNCLYLSMWLCHSTSEEVYIGPNIFTVDTGGERSTLLQLCMRIGRYITRHYR